MGLSSSSLPDNILRRMSREHRGQMGKAGVTSAEADAKFTLRAERELQNLCASWLRQHDLFFIQSRMDKRPTVRKGMPDFIVICPGARALAIEIKVPGGKISDDQKKLHDLYFDQVDRVVHIIFDFDSFRNLVTGHLKVAENVSFQPQP